MSLIQCPECGKEVSDKADCCPKCGMPISTCVLQNNSVRLDETVEEKESGFGIASLILAVLSLFTGTIGMLFLIISAVLGIIALTRKDRKSVCSTISLVIFGIELLISIIIAIF